MKCELCLNDHGCGATGSCRLHYNQTFAYNNVTIISLQKKSTLQAESTLLSEVRVRGRG